MLAYLIGPSNDPSGEGLLLCPFYTPGKLKVEHWQCIVQDHRVHKQKKKGILTQAVKFPELRIL